MKFSEIESGNWSELQPYLDTCVLPVTGLDGSESPWEAAAALEDLRDVLDLIEIPFKGRIVTYPAMHYIGTGQAAASARKLIEDVCARLKDAGFRYVVLVSASRHAEAGLPAGAEVADLIIAMTKEELTALGGEARRSVADKLTELWRDRQSV
ncbi:MULTISPECIES: DUF2487 family protein [Paenibacillus]|uniref:DUF2487 family protein n=1 Tax=Paenibacillus validus TaxID=44253 RepID=A0A7X2ZB80_9BACL|nr:MULTISPECIES: DUF2487 family protein [Paenibacillus]MUG71745.1 DUF2487 family protein [Paenibacillus validus]